MKQFVNTIKNGRLALFKLKTKVTEAENNMLKKILLPTAVVLASVIFAQEPPQGGPPTGMEGGGPPPGMDGGGPPPNMDGGDMPPMGPPGEGGAHESDDSSVQITVQSIQPADLAGLKEKLKTAYPEEMKKIEILFATANRLATTQMLALAEKMHAVPKSASPTRDAIRKLHEAQAKVAAAFPAEYKAMMELRDSDPAAANEELLRLYRALPTAKPEPAAPAATKPVGETKQ